MQNNKIKLCTVGSFLPFSPSYVITFNKHLFSLKTRKDCDLEKKI